MLEASSTLTIEPPAIWPEVSLSRFIETMATPDLAI
jgi:hypothetical protein